MVDATHRHFDISDRSYHALIKKEVHQLAIAAQFGQKRAAELDIVVAEMTSNIHKHAKGGELFVATLQEGDRPYIELICMDSGPGMSDVYRMMTDGYSTKSTMGHGLGSIKRLADVFDIFSAKDWGTIILARIYRDNKPPDIKKYAAHVRPLIVAKPKETCSGDGYFVQRSDRYTKLILVDGLGHGPDANTALNEAVAAFKQCASHSPAEIIRFIHPKVRKTRGLVATIAVIDRQLKQLHIGGVGNISAKLYGGAIRSKSPLPYNGIIGHNIPNTINDQIIDLDGYQQLVLCSDGMRSRWDIPKFPILVRHDPSIQAAAIFKEFARGTDDMSVLVTKFSL